MNLSFQPDAAEELRHAAAYFERERPGFGRLFLREVMSKVELAARLPRSGALLAGLPEANDVRQYILQRFPYSVVTAMIGPNRVVIAVAHHHREPGYWSKRI